MSIPELDLKKVNLQSAVGYLISLHDNEVDWNLLGLHLVGSKESLPIPDGDYKYGDTYMIGNATDGYDMYVWSKADGSVYKEDYWFPVGQFPKPGPQGPKGDGFETVYQWVNGTVQRVDYDTTSGARISQQTTVEYYPTDTGSSTFKTFETVSTLPIVPGKYINIDANSESDAIEVKVDNTALSLDYVPINKTQSSVVPRCQNGQINWTLCTSDNTAPSIMMRDGSGNTKVNNLYVLEGISNIYGGLFTTIPSIYYTCSDPNLSIAKTSTDTGTLSIGQLQSLKTYHQMRVLYDGQLYYAMDPRTAPDGTLNYIHIDSVQDGSGGYKATGKCFSVTVSTRAWQVVDVTFAGEGGSSSTSTVYRHHISYNFSISGTNYNAEFDLFSASGNALTYDEIKSKITLLAPMNVTIVNTGSHLYGAGQMARVGTALHLYGAIGSVTVDLEPSTSTTVWLDTPVQVG